MAAQLSPVRALHWVFKVADRTSTIAFYRSLGFQILRHEEFEEGCAAACNGPYDGKWSKTMIGYGDEDSQFVLELTYNYGIKSYRLGNDYIHIRIHDAGAHQALAQQGAPNAPSGSGALRTTAPGGYAFDVAAAAAGGQGPLVELALNCTQLARSLDYWHGFLGFEVAERSGSSALLRAGPGQCGLHLTELPEGQAMDHGSAFGRVAFSCPAAQLRPLEAACNAAGHTILTPYVSLDTPGKASVEVVILADPDGHEICFVCDEGFRELSARDPGAARLLDDAIAADGSAEWFAKKAAAAAARTAAS